MTSYNSQKKKYINIKFILLYVMNRAFNLWMFFFETKMNGEDGMNTEVIETNGTDNIYSL